MKPDHPFEPHPNPNFGAALGGGCGFLYQSRQRCGFPRASHTATVILHAPPGDVSPLPATGFIADTPANREALEAAAIPRCREWREAHPEYRFEVEGRWYPILNATMFTPENLHPAPYCCSAYCDRCAGLRALDGEPALPPNDWMTQ